MKCGIMSRVSSSVVIQASFYLSLLLISVSGQQDSCTFDIDCKDKGDDRCCSAYGFCGVGPDFCRTGCIYEDTELVGGDLPKRRGGGGKKTRTDDDCAISCENTGGCKYYTYDLENSLCYLKETRGLSRELPEKGKIISGSITNEGCDDEPVCEPPAKLVNLQCIETGEGDLDDKETTSISTDNAVKRTYQGALEYCHVFEAALPYTVVTSQQLYARPMYDRSFGKFKRSAQFDSSSSRAPGSWRSSGRKKKNKKPYQITTPYGLYNLLQGENAPDLFGYETMQRLRRKVCNLPLNDTDSNDVELFDAGDYDGRTEDRRHLEVEGGDSSEDLSDEFEGDEEEEEEDPCMARLESLMYQDPEEVEVAANFEAWNLTKEEMNLLTSQDQVLMDQFPMLNNINGASGLGNLDRWHWLDTPARDDDKCLATIPGMVGKYRMFDCNADLRVICERRGSSPSAWPSQPPAIFNIPKTPATLPTAAVPAALPNPQNNIGLQQSSPVGFQQTSLQFQPSFQGAQNQNFVPQQTINTNFFQDPRFMQQQPAIQQQTNFVQQRPVVQQQVQPQQTSIYDPIPDTLPSPVNLPGLADQLYGGGSAGQSFGSFLEPAIPRRDRYPNDFGAYQGQDRYPRVNSLGSLGSTRGQAQLPKVNPYLRQHDRLTQERNQLFGSSNSFFKKK